MPVLGWSGVTHGDTKPKAGVGAVPGAQDADPEPEDSQMNLEETYFMNCEQKSTISY